MSSSSDTLQFRFPTHGDSILGNINALREKRRFCDVTLLLGGPRGATVQPLHFHGHKVVLAASSDFLRDQFLLHEGQAALNVGVLSSVEVGKRLLLSCYTGLLEVPLRELVSYLTAASALQMSQVMEKCAQAVSQYFSPTLAFLKLERHSEEKEIQQAHSHISQKERNAGEPSRSIHVAYTEEGRAAVIQSRLRLSKGANLDSQGMREARGDRGPVVAKVELSEGAACCLESEKGEEIQPVHTNKPAAQVHHITAISCKQCPPTAVSDHKSSATRGGCSQHEELVNSWQNQDEEAGEEQREEEELFLLVTQLQERGELMNSNHVCLSGTHPSYYTEDSDSILVQRPYLCRRCDRVFQHLGSYVGHLKEHRKYLCLVCGKGFSQKSNLTCHIRIHTGVKPFRCPLCHKTFSLKAMLQDHFSLHTGDRPCALHFAHKPGLKRHLKDIHGKSRLQNNLEEAVN